jgi:hypothetical protein
MRFSAFGLGLCVIVVAPVLNVVWDRLSETGKLPHSLESLYATAGKTGVTGALVCIGFSVMLLGLSAPRPQPIAPPPPPARGVAVPLYTPPEPNEIEPNVSSTGRVVLRTARYLGSQSGSSRRAVPDATAQRRAR